MTSARRHALAALPRLGLVLIVAVASACGSSSTSSGSATGVRITAADGSATTLSALKGSPVVVNMWATWCSPCVKEMPAFDEVAAGESGVRIIGVNVADSAEDAAAFAAKLGVSYPQYTDPDGELSTAFGVTGLPATAFIDANGKVVEVHQGAFTADELRAAIRDQFPEQGSTP